MQVERLTSQSRFALWLSAATLAFFVGCCSLIGWWVGGRPPGWIEGKHLLGSVIGSGLLACGFAATALASALMGLWVAGKVRRRRGSDWLPAGVAGLLTASLLGHIAFPWGFAVIYFVADTRWSFWAR